MFNDPFYHSTLKKLVSGFGKLFSNLYVVREYDSGVEKERIKVPLAYGPKDKFIARLKEDPTLDRGYALKLPRISFEISTVQYDSQRKLNTIKKNSQPIQGVQGEVIRQYQGVPYKIGMTLSIIAKYMEDGNQIVEQILPWFTPAYTITLNTIPGMNYKDDVSVVLTSVDFKDNYEEGWTKRREIVWTLSFELRATFYGPVVEKKIVTEVIADIHATPGVFDLENTESLTAVPRNSRITITPANTTDTVADPDFGYTENLDTFTDDMVYDPVTGEDKLAAFTLKPKPMKITTKIGRPKLS